MLHRIPGFANFRRTETTIVSHCQIHFWHRKMLYKERGLRQMS